MKTFPIGGVHPSENKLSGAKPIEVLPLPDAVAIPLAQHIGAPAAAKVAKGDKVLTGQLIAEAVKLYVGQYPLPDFGNGDGCRCRSQRSGAAPGDDYDQTRGRRVGRGHRPFGDARPRVRAFVRGDHRPDQGRRYRRHGRCDVPHACETLGSSRKKGRSLDYQRRGVRSLT